MDVEDSKKKKQYKHTKKDDGRSDEPVHWHKHKYHYDPEYYVEGRLDIHESDLPHEVDVLEGPDMKIQRTGQYEGPYHSHTYTVHD